MIDRIEQLRQQCESARIAADELRAKYRAAFEAGAPMTHQQPLLDAVREASKAAEDCEVELRHAEFDAHIDTSGANWRLRNDPMHQGKTADLIALAKMSAAEDDDAEACLDAAGESHGGDEFSMSGDFMRQEAARLDDEDMAFERDLLDAKSIADEALIDIADALLAGNSTWRAAKRMHRGIESLADSYV